MAFMSRVRTPYPTLIGALTSLEPTFIVKFLHRARAQRRCLCTPYAYLFFLFAMGGVMSRYRRDHTPGAAWFFTVTLADKNSSLLTTHIDLLRSAWRRTASQHAFETVAVCILPNHLHALWRLPPDDSDYALRWSLIKAGFSRYLPAASDRTGSKLRRREKGIWQRRFWEHRIRDEHDMQHHVDYIHFNPVRHGLVARVKDWPHSSFHRQVRDGLLAKDWAGDSLHDRPREEVTRG